MSRFFSAKYKALTPYTPGEQPKNKDYIKLNTNESPFPPSPKAQAYAKREAENLELERNHRQISNTLLDANAFATELREKAVAEDVRMREENAARNLAQTARIEQFGRKIDEIRDAIHSFLKTIDGELEKESETIDATLRENRMAERNVENAGGITEGEKKE